MTATRVTARYEYKLNIGNYESFNIVVGTEADALDGETAADAHARVADLTEAILMQRVQAAHKEFIEKKQKGKPVEG